jgi:hypothetical protein
MNTPLLGRFHLRALIKTHMNPEFEPI